METPPETRELILLEQIENDPDVTQASLAGQLGVAVGTANFLIKRLIEKGYVKAKRAQRKKLRYIITPEGIAHRARLTVDYIDNSLLLYRRTRLRVLDALVNLRQTGHNTVRIVGDGDIAEIIRLTCIEQGIKIGNDPLLPALEIQGYKIILKLKDQ